MSGVCVADMKIVSKDEFGEVCPIDWNQGDATIKANPKDSLEYFSAADNKRRADELNGNGNGASESNSNKRPKVCISIE